MPRPKRIQNLRVRTYSVRLFQSRRYALVDAAPEGAEKTEALRKLFNYEKSVGLIRFHEANPEVGSRF